MRYGQHIRKEYQAMRMIELALTHMLRSLFRPRQTAMSVLHELIEGLQYGQVVLTRKSPIAAAQERFWADVERLKTERAGM